MLSQTNKNVQKIQDVHTNEVEESTTEQIRKEQVCTKEEFIKIVTCKEIKQRQKEELNGRKKETRTQCFSIPMPTLEGQLIGFQLLILAEQFVKI